MSPDNLPEPESTATGSVKPRAGWAAYSAAIGFGSALLVIVIMPLCMLAYCATEHLGPPLGPVGSLLGEFGLPAAPVLIPLLLRLMVVRHVERNYRTTTQQSQQVGNVGCILYLVHMPLIGVMYLVIGFGKWPCYGW